MATSSLVLGDSAQAHHAAAKFLALYLDSAYAARMAKEVNAASTDDVARVETAVRLVQRQVLTEWQVPHTLRDAPVLFSGYGICDQVNAAAARVLAGSFARVELLALIDPKTKSSPHAVARVWSTQRNEWIYFDAYWDHPVVYRRAGHGIEFLDNGADRVYRGRDKPPVQLYAYPSIVMARLHPTYAGYLIARAAEKLRGQEPIRPPKDPPAGPYVPPPRKADAEAVQHLEEEYAEARADDLLGREEEAAQRYNAIAADPIAQQDDLAAELATASRRFAAIIARDE